MIVCGVGAERKIEKIVFCCCSVVVCCCICRRLHNRYEEQYEEIFRIARDESQFDSTLDQISYITLLLSPMNILVTIRQVLLLLTFIAKQVKQK